MSGQACQPWQRAFAAALLDPAAPVPTGLVAWNRSDPAVRFAVHRNNVVASLVAALGDGFPVVRQLVGEAFFAAMARQHVREQPPRSPVLVRYGDDFAEGVAAFEPAAALPYLADVARLERARVVACHAADAPPLDPGDVARHLADPAGLAMARVALHPSLSVLDSPHAVVSLWAAHQAEGEMPVVEIDRPEAALVLRDARDEVLVLPVGPATAAFVDALARGQPLADAIADAQRRAGPEGVPFDLSSSLALLFRHGAVVAWHPPGDLE